MNDIKRLQKMNKELDKMANEYETMWLINCDGLVIKKNLDKARLQICLAIARISENEVRTEDWSKRGFLKK